MKRSTMKRKALTLIAASLAGTVSWYAQAGPTNDIPAMPVMGQAMNNTGYVFVSGQGYKDGEMLFCEPSVGHYIYNSWDGAPALEVKEGKCVSVGFVGSGRTYRAVTAQQYLDELIGPGKVVPVGIAPATTHAGWLLAIIYYRSINTGSVVPSGKSDGS